MAKPRAWRKLDLSIGLLRVPVAVAPLTKDGTAVKGKMFDADTHNEVERVYRDKVTGKDCQGTVTGYEHEGKLVFFEGDELTALKNENSNEVALTGFTSVGDIDPIYYEKSYMIWPQDGSEAQFNLFREVIKELGIAAVGAATLTGYDRLFVVRWSEAMQTLVAHTCVYDAMIKTGDVASIYHIGGREPSEEEVELATQLLSNMKATFDPTSVTDTRTERLLEAIAEKAKSGKKVTVQPSSKKAEAPSNIMDALRASVAAAESKKKSPKPKVTA